MYTRSAGSIVWFWAAALVAAAYWMLVGWRVEESLWRILGWAVPAHAAEGLVALPLMLGFVFLTFLLPPVAFAAFVRLSRLRSGKRTWAIPATGFLLVLVFMGSAAQIVEGRPLVYVPISVWLDESWLALGVALAALAIGSLLGGWILGQGSRSHPGTAEAAA